MRMRIAGLALVVLALVATGCNTRQRIAGGAAAVTAVGVALTFSKESRSEDEIGTQGKVGIVLLLTGIVTLFVVAAIDESSTPHKPLEIKATNPHGDPSEIREREDRARSDAQTKRAQAWELTKQAHTAARAGDCARVTELSAQVGALDPELYADVFISDVAVQRCLTPAAAPATGPATGDRVD